MFWGVLSRSQSSRCLALTAVENPSCQQWTQKCHRTQHSIFFLTCPGLDASRIIKNIQKPFNALQMHFWSFVHMSLHDEKSCLTSPCGMKLRALSRLRTIWSLSTFWVLKTPVTSSPRIQNYWCSMHIISCLESHRSRRHQVSHVPASIMLDLGCW